MNDIDWAELPSAALALARIVTQWRSHEAYAQGCRDRAAEIRAGKTPLPDGMTQADWAQFPALLDSQAEQWDKAVEADVAEFRDAVAKVIAAGGRLTRAQTAQFTAVATLAEADAAVTALKRELF
jgi:hypothetical protein